MKKLLFYLIVIAIFFQSQAQVAINNDGSAPDASAMLDVKSTTSGLLIPRMQAVDRDNIASPATGLIVFVTDDNSFYYYDGTSWLQLETSGKSWLLNGNSGTDGSQFVGTTDAQPLIFKTNNIERVHINENGVIGINTSPVDNILLKVESDTHSYIGNFESSQTNSDDVAVLGSAAASDHFGYGGYFIGGYMGSLSFVGPTGSDDYYGSVNLALGGSGSNYGVSSFVSGSGTNYAFFSSSMIPTGNGSIAFFANSDDTGTGMIVIGSNVPTYFTLANGTAISATGKLNTITAHSEEDDNDAVMILGQYEGTTLTDATGVVGYSVPTDSWGYGVKGFGGWIGVYGSAQNGFYGVEGDDGGGTSSYGVFSSGDMGASGTKSFAIDHPLDPENKILKHFSIESNEVLNVYRGNVVLDANGHATVKLPEYFMAINKNFSYNLTPVGSAAPNIYIAKEISNDGSFEIAGGNPGQKISWYVYAERNDLYLQKYPEKRRTELEKPKKMKGKYIMPRLYNQTKSNIRKYQTVKKDNEKPSDVKLQKLINKLKKQ